MRTSIHQREDEKYRHTNPEEEEKIRQENEVTNASSTDITHDENIVELEEAARSEEGIDSRQEHMVRHDVGEDREDNNEPPPLDIPSSAIIS